MPYSAHSQIQQNLPRDDSHLGYISDPKNYWSTRFLLFADFTQWIIEAFCQSSCCRQCMINWALVEPARVNWPPHWDHRKNHPKPIQMDVLGPKIYRFGLRTLILFREMIFLIFGIFMSNLNGLCDFYHDLNVGINLPWSGEPGLQ
jgi:hypothetical protein